LQHTSRAVERCITMLRSRRKIERVWLAQAFRSRQTIQYRPSICYRSACIRLNIRLSRSGLVALRLEYKRPSSSPSISLIRTSIMAASSSTHTQSGRLGLFTIAILLVICSGFTIGLTFAPCHSSLCVEQWFPSQARIHIAVFYSGISIAAIYLAAWSKSKAIRSVSDRYLFDKPLPLIRLRLSLGEPF
jgi:hypothetical protein